MKVALFEFLGTYVVEFEDGERLEFDNYKDAYHYVYFEDSTILEVDAYTFG